MTITCFIFYIYIVLLPVVNAAPKSVPVKAKPLPKVPLWPSLEDQEIYGFVLDWFLAFEAFEPKSYWFNPAYSENIFDKGILKFGMQFTSQQLNKNSTNGHLKSHFCTPDIKILFPHVLGSRLLPLIDIFRQTCDSNEKYLTAPTPWWCAFWRAIVLACVLLEEMMWAFLLRAFRRTALPRWRDSALETRSWRCNSTGSTL